MRYEILCYDDFLEVKTYGDAELQIFKDFIRNIFTHENWQPGGALLINHSELNAAPLTTDEIREMADFTKPFLSQIGQAKIAILVARDLEFGVGRMWQVFASEGRESAREVFRSRDEAISWLKNE
jgi:hypothetical protein